MPPERLKLWFFLITATSGIGCATTVMVTRPDPGMFVVWIVLWSAAALFGCFGIAKLSQRR